MKTGVALGAFAGWGEVIDQAWQQGATGAGAFGKRRGPGHCGRHSNWSMGARRPTNCATFICCGSTGAIWVGRAGLKPGGCWRRASVAEGQRWARRVVALTGGQAEYWCRESLGPGPAPFANRTDGFQNHVAAGTAEPRVPTAGAARNGMVAAQLIDTAPKTRPDQPNHLNCNATGPPAP